MSGHTPLSHVSVGDSLTLSVSSIGFLVNIDGILSFHVIYVAMKLYVFSKNYSDYFRKKPIQVESDNSIVSNTSHTVCANIHIFVFT